jgi:toxin-antitoxin system PIN domain toxin
MAFLLDANVLIAWHTPTHVHHSIVDQWLANTPDELATCPMTQGALVRFAIREGLETEASIELVNSLSNDPRHVFWPDDLGFHQVSMVGVVGHRQVTDAYLAQLARHHNSKLATLDMGLAAQHRDVTQLLLAT